MAFNDAPTTIWPSYTSDGTNITIPIAALDGLTAGLAHTSTGDWRAIVLAFQQTVFRHYNALAAENRPLAVVPKAPSQFAMSSGSFVGQTRITYSIEFYSPFGTPSVAAEPT